MELDLAEIDAALGGTDAGRAGARARRSAGRASRRALGRDRRAVLRLRLRARHAAIRTRSRRRSGRCGPGLASPAHARRVRDNLRLFERPGGIVDEHARDRRAVGRAVRLGAAAAVRRPTACAATASTPTPTASRAPGCRCWSRTSSAAARWSRSTTSSGAPPTSPAGSAFGYASNEIGFGWTNGVALELLADLR